MRTVEEQLQEIEQQLKQEKGRRMFERYQTVKLHLLGQPNDAIAVSIGRKESTVVRYLRQYRNHGLEGLKMKFSPGPPEQLSKEQPAKFNWTLQIIAEYIRREFGKTYSIRGASKLTHRMELSYTNPTYTMAAADEQKQKQFVEETFPRLKTLRKRRN